MNSSFTIGELELLREFQQRVINGEINDPYFSTFIGDITDDIDINSESLWHWTALAQHYGTHTRLADVTSDSLVALYFACERNPKDDGFVHIFQSNFNLIDRGNLSLAVFGENYFDVVAIKDDENDIHPREPQDDTTTVIIPPFPNRRVEVQKGAFCFKREIKSPAYWGGQLSYRVPANKKETILDELKKLGYEKDTIYPPEYGRNVPNNG